MKLKVTAHGVCLLLWVSDRANCLGIVQLPGAAVVILENDLGVRIRNPAFVAEL